MYTERGLVPPKEGSANLNVSTISATSKRPVTNQGVSGRKSPQAKPKAQVDMGQTSMFNNNMLASPSKDGKFNKS
jgi:hypothetical protein